MYDFCIFSKLSDLSKLYAKDEVDSGPSNVQSEIFERKIKGLEKENKDLNRRIQGTLLIMLNMYVK